MILLYNSFSTACVRIPLDIFTFVLIHWTKSIQIWLRIALWCRRRIFKWPIFNFNTGKCCIYRELHFLKQLSSITHFGHWPMSGPYYVGTSAVGLLWNLKYLKQIIVWNKNQTRFSDRYKRLWRFKVIR